MEKRGRNDDDLEELDIQRDSKNTYLTKWAQSHPNFERSPLVGKEQMFSKQTSKMRKLIVKEDPMPLYLLWNNTINQFKVKN